MFELSPPTAEGGAWSYQMLHEFAGGSNGDGAEPEAALVFRREGSLYGTTAQGGNTVICDGAENIWDGCGTVFQLTPSPMDGGPWTETILHAFTGYADGQDGAALLGPVTFGEDGKL